MKKLLYCLGLFLVLLALGGCTTSTTTPTPASLQLTDSNNRVVTLKGKPQRIVALSPSFVELVQALDGSLVGTASSNLIAADDKLAKVGFIFNINTEKVLSLQPDLVIGYQGMHERYLPFFEEMGIPVLMLKLKTYDDVENCLTLLGQALQAQAQATRVKEQLAQEIQDTIKQTRHTEPSIAIIHYSSQGIALESEQSIAGNTAKLLHLHNVLMDAPQLTSLQKGNEFIPYNLEMLIQQNPQVIFVTSMGTGASVNEYIQKEIIHNPSWATVTAVQKQQVYYLPEELFLTNPGLRYPQAVKYMAEKISSLSKEATRP